MDEVVGSSYVGGDNGEVVVFGRDMGESIGKSV